MIKFLDIAGLSYFWSKIKAYVTKENAKIPFGQIDSTSTDTAFTAQVAGITELVNGVCVYLTNGVVTSASGWTLNVNNLGAKPVYGTLASATRTTTIFNVNYTMLFVYNENRVSGGCWDIYYGYDSNTNTIGYQIRTNSMSLPVSGITARYRLVFRSADGTKFVPANTSTSTNATSARAVCQDKIDPFGEIRYYSYTTQIASGSRIGATYLWQQYAIVLGYSFNRTGVALTLTSWKPVYVKCTPQTDGSAIMDADTPIVQTLPSTEDGKIYIYLGIAYDATHIELVPHHPVYCYKDGAVRQWTNASTVTAETDPVFTASPAHGITASDISNWNGKSDFSGSYNDLTNKPIYFGTCPTAETETVKIVTLDDADGFSLEAGAKIAVSFDSRHNPYVSTPKLNVNNTGVRDIVFPQIGYPTTSITELCGWSQYETVYFKYTGSKWLMFTSSMAMSILFQRDELRADWEETDNSSLSYIDNKPNVPVRVYGTTQTKTPTEVKEALSDGNIVEIAHEDQTFSFLTFFSFNYSWAFRLLISNTLVDYQGSTYLYTLVGNTNNDTWSGSATPMAKLSDIPTVPTNVSSFTNDAGYLTSYTETDPTVPAWAKASTKPSYTASEVGALPTSGGQLTGDLTLYVASGNSPGLIFQRGTLTDNYNDWMIYDKGGYLYFAQRGSGSSSFGDMGYIDTTGVLRGFTIPWGSVSGKPSFATVATSGSYNDLSDTPAELPTVSASDNGKVLRVVNGAWSAVALPSASGVSF